MTVSHASIEVDGAELRRRRKASGLSITELAARSGLSDSYISAIERGQRPTMAPRTYPRLLAALNIENHDALIRKAGAA